MMSFLTDALDTLGGYGTTIKNAAATTVKDLADATVVGIADTIKNAGKPSSAVPEQHANPPKGTDFDGSTVIPLPTSASTPAAVAQAAKDAGLPLWAIVLLVISGVAVVGGVMYVVVSK